MKRPAIIALIVGTAALGGLFAFRHDIRDAMEQAQRGSIPEPVSLADIQAKNTNAVPTNKPTNSATNTNTNGAKPKPTNSPTPTNTPAPTQPKPTTSINLAVPFIVQAPYAIWDAIHEDGCEEASAAMVNLYYKGIKGPLTADQMEEHIMEVVRWEDEHFGTNKDTTAEQTAQIMRELFGLKAKVVALTSIDQIKTALAAGQPVIVPAYGRALYNPYYKNGGPVYHMLQIKGYKGTKIITNDSGTKRGADYIYDQDVLFNAIHDWNGGDVPNGAKVMIVVE